MTFLAGDATISSPPFSDDYTVVPKYSLDKPYLLYITVYLAVRDKWRA